MMPRASVQALGVLLVLATACGGGGGDTGGVTGGGPVAGFQAEQPDPSAQAVSMAEGSKSADTVTVRLNVTGTNDVYAASLDLHFDSTAVQYVGWSKGSLLESGGHTPVYNVGLDSSNSSHLLVGASRTGSAPGVDVSGTLTLIHLTFRVKKEGQFVLSPSNQSLYDAQNPPVPIAGLSWFGGWLTGT